MKNLLSVLALLIGESVIIGAFLLFGGLVLPTRVLVLDIIVSSVVYLLFVVDLLIPWISLSDPAHRQVGSLGLRWTVNCLYALLALCTIGVGIYCEWGFTLQLLIQVALLGVLAFGYLGVLSVQDKVADIQQRDAAQRQAFEERKRHF
ncbi:MAG: hypothetical protein IJ064_02495 [Bacteroidaceae bacterium]|nr:hypothetical protein [Bacteroidaceae bacterium]